MSKSRRTRSVETLLTRFAVAALAVIAISVGAAGALGLQSAYKWEDIVKPRVTKGVGAKFSQWTRDAQEAARDRAANRDAVALLRQPTSVASQRGFDDLAGRFFAPLGFNSALIIADSGRVAYAWSSGDSANAARPAIPHAVFARMDSVGMIGTFLPVGDAVVLLGGAPLRDRDGHAAGGYLVLIQPVTARFLTEAEAALSLRLRVRPGTIAAERTAPIADGDSLQILLPLKDVFGASIATVEATVGRHSLNRLMRWGALTFALLLTLSAAGIGAVWYAAHRSLVVPLRTMTRDIEAMRLGATPRARTGELPATELHVLQQAFADTVRSLSEFQRRYRDVFDRASDALFLLEAGTGRVLDANPATAALTGVPSAEIIGETLPAELLPGGAGEQVVRWRRRDGVTMSWGVATSEVTLEGGPATLAAYRDLTGREAVAHSQKMEAVGALAGGVAHDFNNLMGAALTGAAAARALLDEGHPALAAIAGIEHAATRAAELTRQLLRFSRRDPLRLGPVDIARAVETVGTMCSRTFDRRVAIDAWSARDLPAVLGDAGEIEQALLNLCINARDAMPEGGSLRVEARRLFLDMVQAHDVGAPTAGTFVEIVVADTGTGMPEDVKAHIFEPFFTTKEPGHGTGLGLALVRGLARQLGGAIDVQSSVGRGTTVRLLFPALSEAPDPGDVPVAVARRSPPPTGQPVVLLVDDERALREMLRMVLNLSGYAVIEASNGTCALEELRKRRDQIRVVLLDMMLPGELSGLETLTRLRTIDSALPVLLCTGFIHDDDVSRVRALGVEDVLMKPVDINDLVRRLDAICDATHMTTSA